MKLIRPSVEIMHMTPNPLALIEAAGRTCYKSEEKIGCKSKNPCTFTPNDCDQCPDHSSYAFVKMILKRGHESVLEHASATVRFICDRGVSHEIVRHRLASYSQESTRYCDYGGGEVAFIIPSWTKFLPGVADVCTDDVATKSAEDCPDFYWLISMQQAEDNYKRLRELGWKPEQARSVLPNSLKTEVVMTANFREWRHFFKLRTSPAAHPQMREVAQMLLDQFRELVPVVFEEA